MSWDDVRALFGDEKVELGPMIGHQVRRKPRHVLFTLARYKFAAKMLGDDRRLRVVEIGCSEGFGTRLLAEAGHEVLGIDSDAAALAHAQAHMGGPTLSFAAEMPAGRERSFDAAVSLDVIEHVPQAEENAFVALMTAALGDDGFAVVGTPNLTAAAYASPESNAGHINLYDAKRLTTLFRAHFRQVFLFGMNDEVLHTGYPAMCHYLFVLACAPKR